MSKKIYWKNQLANLRIHDFYKKDILTLNTVNVNEINTKELEANNVDAKIIVADSINSKELDILDTTENIKCKIKTNLEKGKIYEVSGKSFGIVIDKDTVVLHGYINVLGLNLNLEKNTEYYYDSIKKQLTIMYTDNKFGYSLDNNIFFVF